MKLYVSDVDGTLVSMTKDFSDDLIKVISKINNSGDLFVLCSGRPVEPLVKVAEKLNLKGANIKYVSGYNGVRIFDLEQNKIICDYSLTKEEVVKIAKVLDEKNIEYGIFREGMLHSNNLENKHAIHESTLNNIEHRLFDELFSSPKVVVFVDNEKQDEVLNYLKKNLEEFTVVDSAPIFIDITKKGINKATTLDALSEIHNIKHENTFGFGDSGNDLELIKKAYTSVAVSNAKDEIKKNATHITDSVENDGVYKFLNKNI